jgi:hypothetical protein
MTFDSIITSGESLTLAQGAICAGVALVLGVISALVYMYKSYCSKNFAVTLALLPPIVAMLIIMVNGNLGTGIAVVGVFSLVRFRSQPGNSRESLAIMLSMAIGLACGTGYVTFAAFGAILVCIVWLVLFSTPFGNTTKKELKIDIPENLDYEGLFDDIFNEFTTRQELVSVKTVQMGSVYELRYQVTFKRDKNEKDFLDALRARNGNLPLQIGRVSSVTEL